MKYMKVESQTRSIMGTNGTLNLKTIVRLSVNSTLSRPASGSETR
jgi:hypothetical protein